MRPVQSLHTALLLVIGSSLWLGLCVAGCGGSDGAGGPDGTAEVGDLAAGPAPTDGGAPTADGPASADDFERALAAATCAWEARCGTIGASELARCVADAASHVASYPQPWTPQSAITHMHLAYDSGGGAACLAAVAGAPCGIDGQLAFIAACNQAYQPLVGVGGACSSRYECAGGWCDLGPTGNEGCSGTCKAFLALGATCSPSESHCGRFDYCDGTTSKCTARAAAGSPCGDSPLPECQTGLFCIGYVPVSGGQTEVPGVCGPPGQAGQTCTFFYFGNTSCAPGLYCDGATNIGECKDRLYASAECASAEACRDGLDCVGLVRDANGKVVTKGHCAPFLDVGAPCTDPTSSHSGCPWDARCDAATKKCVASGVLGDDCGPAGTDGECATDLYCNDQGRCARAFPLGGACTPPGASGVDGCQRGDCDPTTRVCTLSCTL